MDKQYSVKFFTSFVEAMQKFCREYIDFEQCVELSGYLAVEIDNHKKERYVLSEMLQSSGNVISESYCTKAFKTLRKEPSAPRGHENIAPKMGPRTNQSHADEVTIVLRDSPEMGPHATHSNIARHQNYSNQRSGAFNPRGYSSGLGNQIHARESIKLGNPFDQQARNPHNQIQPRQFESSTRNNSTFSSPSSSAQKRTAGELNNQQDSPASKREKTDLSSSTQDDASSMRHVYSGVTDSGESSSIQQTTASAAVSFPSPSSSQGTSESIRLPLSATVKEEHVSSVMSLETSDDNQEHTAESDFNDTLQESLSLGMDPSAAYSNNSHGGSDDASQSTLSSGYMSQFKMQYPTTSSQSAEGSTCRICGAEVGTPVYLRQHMEKHSGARFSCRFCGRSYSFRSSLRRHKRSCYLRNAGSAHDLTAHDITGRDISAHDLAAHILGHDISGQDVSGHDMSGHDVSGHDVSGHDMSGHDMSGHDMSGYDGSGHDGSGHDGSGHDGSGHDVS